MALHYEVGTAVVFGTGDAGCGHDGAEFLGYSVLFVCGEGTEVFFYVLESVPFVKVGGLAESLTPTSLCVFVEAVVVFVPEVFVEAVGEDGLVVHCLDVCGFYFWVNFSPADAEGRIVCECDGRAGLFAGWTLAVLRVYVGGAVKGEQFCPALRFTA